MNFFNHQDAAKRNTKRLVLFFLLAVISLVALTDLLVIVLLGAAEQKTHQATSQALNLDLIITISLVVIGVITLGSLYKIMALSKGGGVYVAESLGGRLLTRDSPQHQKVLNVVEEIAIAAGTPVPPVYLLEEEGINAFAAGYSPSDAVIGITRGAINHFNRDELQGVIAHEFSHIVNGDMRLNIRLMGILHGILLIGLIGYYILRSSGHRQSSKNNGNTALLGIGLIVIGYGGIFFGNLIKAAVSRQREFLADASAVQFTRNPNGIANALKRIAGYPAGSSMNHPKTAEISHALFGEGVKSSFAKLFATHPPIVERIRRLSPEWKAEEGIEQDIQTTDSLTQTNVSSGFAVHNTHVSSEHLENLIGNPNQIHLHYATQIHEQIPTMLMQACHDPFSARALIYFLLLDQDPEILQKQLSHIQHYAQAHIWEETVKFLQNHADLSTKFHLPLVEMSIATLRQLSKNQYLTFRNNVIHLIEIDQKLSLFEWSLQQMLFHHLDAAFQLEKRRHDNKTLQQETKSAEILLSFLANFSSQKNMDAKSTFEHARKQLPISITLLSQSELGLEKINAALNALTTLKPTDKSKFVTACAKCINADQEISTTESELFRAIASVLDCPTPPFVTR